MALEARDKLQTDPSAATQVIDAWTEQYSQETKPSTNQDFLHKVFVTAEAIGMDDWRSAVLFAVANKLLSTHALTDLQRQGHSSAFSAVCQHIAQFLPGYTSFALSSTQGFATLTEGNGHLEVD